MQRCHNFCDDLVSYFVCVLLRGVILPFIIVPLVMVILLNSLLDMLRVAE